MEMSFQNANIFRPWISGEEQKTCMTVPMKHHQKEEYVKSAKSDNATVAATSSVDTAGYPDIGFPYPPVAVNPWQYLDLPELYASTAQYVDQMQLSYMISQHFQEEQLAKAMRVRKQRPRKFKCPHCDVRFSNSGQLRGHVRIHTGERPFSCDAPHCGKTFTRNEELTRHKRIHSGIRPHACTVCGKKFGRRDHLKKHTKIHAVQFGNGVVPDGAPIFIPLFPYV